MTAPALAGGAADAPRLAPLARPAVIVLALGGVVVARWAAWRSGLVDPIVVGALFGGALVALGAAAGWRPARWANLPAALVAVALGLAGGLVLAATALVGPHPTWSAQLAAGLPLGPWAAATILVAASEEAVLRGVLFDALDRPLGIGVALIGTSVAFALVHVPVFGLQAVPLDLGVGLVLGGLRLVSGGVAAPAIAHVLADLAVLWL